MIEQSEKEKMSFRRGGWKPVLLEMPLFLFVSFLVVLTAYLDSIYFNENVSIRNFNVYLNPIRLGNVFFFLMLAIILFVPIFGIFIVLVGAILFMLFGLGEIIVVFLINFVVGWLNTKYIDECYCYACLYTCLHPQSGLLKSVCAKVGKAIIDLWKNTKPLRFLTLMWISFPLAFLLIILWGLPVMGRENCSYSLLGVEANLGVIVILFLVWRIVSVWIFPHATRKSYKDSTASLEYQLLLFCGGLLILIGLSYALPTSTIWSNALQSLLNIVLGFIGIQAITEHIIPTIGRKPINMLTKRGRRWRQWRMNHLGFPGDFGLKENN